MKRSTKYAGLEAVGQNRIIQKIAGIAQRSGARVYAVGGFVRDFFLGKRIKDIDFVVEGDGIAFAAEVAKHLKTRNLTVYKKFGTALITHRGHALEFVGARKESYRGHSRKPKVAPADLQTDLARRDFTINAMAVSLNRQNYLELIDPFHGMRDLKRRIIQTPLEPKITFRDDPLRIMRGIRFSAQLGFELHPATLSAMQAMHKRLGIISQERITDEFLKIIDSPRPSLGLKLMDTTGVLRLVFPEIDALKGVEEKEGYHHKDVYLHTLEVLDNVAAVSSDTRLRLTALLHDIAKPKTKEFVKARGWSFHGHEEIGARMLPGLFRRLRLSTDWLKYVQKLTRLHLRPIALTEEECTDSAYRRLLFQAGEELEDLLTLCRADITSKNPARREKHLKNFDFVVTRLAEVEQKDRMRAFQSPVRGDEIMSLLQIGPGPLVGKVKALIEEAILEGDIPNDYAAAKNYLCQLIEQTGRADFEKSIDKLLPEKRTAGSKTSAAAKLRGPLPT